MRLPARAALPSLLLAAALTACGDAAPSTGPNGTLPALQVATEIAATTGDEIAGDVGDLLAGEVAIGAEAGAQRSAPGRTDGVNLSVAGSAAPLCAFDANSGRHVCPTVSVEGMTRAFSFQLRDAAGAAMAEYSPSLTASVNLRYALDGTISASHDGAAWSVALHHARDYTASGLAGAETARTWNGTGTSADTVTYEGEHGSRTYATQGSHVTTNVVFDLPRSANRYPRSGTIERTVSGTITVRGAQQLTTSVARTVRATFDGDQSVRLDVVGSGTVVTCALDLLTRQVSGCTQQ